MTKGARKSGGSRKRSQRQDFRRKSRGRPEKTKILIVGEGQQTEPNYFGGLRLDPSISPRFTITVKKGHGHSPATVVREAIDYRRGAEERHQEFDEVWCVLDVEGPGKRESLNAAVALAERKDIKLFLSNPCFEVWLLSHFVRQAKYYIDSGKVIEDLNKHWRDGFGIDYRKNDERIYDRIAEFTSTAIGNAQSARENDHRGKGMADANSSTEVYLLVRRLLEDNATSQE